MIFQKGQEVEHNTYSQFCKKLVTCVFIMYLKYTEMHVVLHI